MPLSDGFTTKPMRDEYMKTKRIEPSREVLTLNGHDNNTDTLYFWQLFSILGETKITDIITNFYKHVLNDTQDDLFRDTFKESGNLDYHVRKQVNFWVDVTGGGKRYPGGEARLELHHDNAKIIMNEKGGSRWLYHMRNAIDREDLKDPRVIRCIIEFINFFMGAYGNQYNFKSRL